MLVTTSYFVMYLVYHVLNRLIRISLLRYTGIPYYLAGIVAFVLVGVIMHSMHGRRRKRR